MNLGESRSRANRTQQSVAASKTLQQWRTHRLLTIELILLLAFLVAPFVVGHYAIVIITRLLVLSLLAISFDLVWGFGGIMSFGQSLFFGCAAYVAAIMARDFGIDAAYIVLPTGALVGFSVALLSGLFLLSGRSGASTEMFGALGTLIGCYMAERFVRRNEYLGGQNGISIPSDLRLGTFEISEGLSFYFLTFTVALVVYLGCRWIGRSQLGLVLAGLRADERRIAFFGYNVFAIKVALFSVAGAVSGLSGVLYAYHERFISPAVIGVTLATQAVLYTLFGGAGTLAGPVIGVVVVEGISYQLADRLPFVWPIVLAILLLALVIFRPSGVVGLLVSEKERTGLFGGHGFADEDREGDHGTA